MRYQDRVDEQMITQYVLSPPESDNIENGDQECDGKHDRSANDGSRKEGVNNDVTF